MQPNNKKIGINTETQLIFTLPLIFNNADTMLITKGTAITRNIMVKNIDINKTYFSIFIDIVALL